MEQRNSFDIPQTPTVNHDQIWSRPHPDPSLHLGAGNESFMLPTNDAARAVALRPNAYPSSSYSNYTATNNGPSFGPYLHPSSTASSSWFPPNQALYGLPPYLDQYGSNIVEPHAEILRASFKRKSPTRPLAETRENSTGYYIANSPSNPRTSFNPLLPEPMTWPQSQSSDTLRVSHGYRNDYQLGSREDSRRNVRSRHNYHTRVESNPTVAYPSSNLPHFHGAGNSSGLRMGGYSSQMPMAAQGRNLSSDFTFNYGNSSSHSMGGHLSHAQMPISVQGRNLSSDSSFSYAGPSMGGHSRHARMPTATQGRDLSSDSSFSYDSSQSFARSGVTNTTFGANRVFQPNSNWRSNAIPLPTPHEPFTQGIGANTHSFNQISNSYRPISSYTPVDVEGGGPSPMETVVSSRYFSPFSITERRSYRNRRTRSPYSRSQRRISYNRSQSSYYGDNTYMILLSEVAAVIDESTLFVFLSWFDEHREMRLDADNMSYEELLALEDRIGIVTRGLSEESISGCLEETTYCLSNQTEDGREEEKCVICLEGYKDRDKLGRLNCGHNFHVDCIKNWLVVKNACPLCKAAAVRDST
ncbi:uncharacterized protein A4U43_C05F5280 [Asparagus officinalis]|uniref:RING-type E3 ubiquitin transferase n=1 Tax=Asparagus officinalis TaxID=4686 RepID=A0A5P1ES35_ASPOF|nr:uncharacterized protein LOC109840307 [Asparagus officinalis]XP_020264478.1 uncharacterized protein LOC109840307 [Asparagus officinalis]XP_020264479.1 uncharacterized protein LOC109840307 [Asparagus officinalis]XP_020264480.1 uncharacterized protein LOC109840307 [Asparagus officinalis]XP_020264481.1 uncharacterized protein LOC109840307 [Asparagus officinalis]XP_020264482.1 uncharacterized protein LOC109840307 [Asparagus officinalis]XP_020264483.1 uncharacterized protein LOC109840307 [Aspara